MKIKIFMCVSALLVIRPSPDLVQSQVFLCCLFVSSSHWPFFIPQMCHTVLDFMDKIYILFSASRFFLQFPQHHWLRTSQVFYPCFTAWLKFHDPDGSLISYSRLRQASFLISWVRNLHSLYANWMSSHGLFVLLMSLSAAKGKLINKNGLPLFSYQTTVNNIQSFMVELLNFY